MTAASLSGCVPLPPLSDVCVRGLRKIALHVTMSVLAFQATALVHLQVGQQQNLRWMVRQVA